MMDNKAAASIGIGSLFVYAGIKGYSILRAIQNVIQGKAPNEGQSASLLSANAAGGSGSDSTGNGVPGISGGILTASQVSQLWTGNGGNPAKASVAVCIASHESAFNTAAISSNPDGGVNVGVWQLDTKGKGAGHTVDELKDPNTNARIAVQASSNGTDWSAWSTAPMCGV